MIKVSELSEALNAFDPDQEIDWILKPEYVTYKQIRAARAFLGWSLKELETRCGVSTQTLLKVLSGDSVRHYTKHDVIKCMVDNGIIFCEDGLFYNADDQKF